MKIHAEYNPHPNNKNVGNIDLPFDCLSKEPGLSSMRPWGKAHLKRQIMNVSIVFLWMILLPVCAIADRCVEGDCVNGKGTMIYFTERKYVGEFKNGIRDGHGVLAMPLGRTLEGQFVRNYPIEGTFTFPNSKAYTGTWEFWNRNGQGILKYPDGRIYEGEFKSGLRNGKGVMTWPDGRRYEGEFVRGERTGKGIMTYPDGRVYTGDFEKGERSGNGVMILPNGDFLEGHFLHGEYFGPKNLSSVKGH
jgi:hypothetical protein